MKTHTDQIKRIMLDAGFFGEPNVELIKKDNHVYRIETGGKTYFLKTYTKSWYGDDMLGTAGCVKHEEAAYKLLEQNNISTPRVLLTQYDSGNPLGRPFIMISGLQGLSLLEVLHKQGVASSRDLLREVGQYLKRIHSIAHPYPGYIGETLPSAPPAEHKCQHRSWTPEARRAEALKNLSAQRDALPGELVSCLEERFTEMPDALRQEGKTACFIHGDCHVHQFFVLENVNGWQVTGVIDMEVSSFGDPVEDLLKFSIEMAREFPESPYWWDFLMEGYGGNVRFEGFKLRMLGTAEKEFRWGVRYIWAAPWADILKHMRDAKNWHELFSVCKLVI
jgi:aminoglycoside phosphotransferase (APT) family kinase protein